MVKIDLKDRKILATLDMDARIPLSRLARTVGLSRQIVEYRIEKLLKEGVISGFYTIFDSGVVGLYWYKIIIRLGAVTKEEKSKIIDYLKNRKYILWLGELGGNWDIGMNVAFRDSFSLSKALGEMLEIFGKNILAYEILTYTGLTDYSRNYLYSDNSTKRKWFEHGMRYNKKIKLDETNKKILNLISTNSKITNVELGNILGISRNTIKNRVDEILNKELILGFRAMINPGILGYQSYGLYIAINKFNSEREKALFAYLGSHYNVIFVQKLLGKWRIGMEVEVEGPKEFQNFLVDIRGKFSDIITDFETYTIFFDHVINYMPTNV